MVQFNPTNDTIIEKGHEIFSQIATSATSAGLFSGTSGLNITLNQLSDRCAAFGRLYERWQLKSLTVTYFPIVGTTTNGAISVGILDDVVEADANSSIQTFANVAAIRTSFHTQVYAPSSVRWTPTDPKKMYYTDANPGAAGNVPEYRFAAPCSIYAIASSSALNSNSSLGYLRFDYVIKFAGAITPSNITSVDKPIPLLPRNQTISSPSNNNFPLKVAPELGRATLPGSFYNSSSN